MIREVLQEPDPRLRAVAVPIEAVTDEVRALADDLVQTMRHGAREAIGLAAPQVGVGLRMFVMQESLKDSGRPKIYVCINPEIVGSGGTMSFAEGCLSFPDGAIVRTKRAAWIVLSWLDRDGRPRTKRIAGLLAVCAQHELDHLDGKLMVDHGELEERET